MEKRLILFVILSILIVVGFGQLRLILNPPPPPEVGGIEGDADPENDPPANDAPGDAVAGVDERNAEDGLPADEGPLAEDGSPDDPADIPEATVDGQGNQIPGDLAHLEEIEQEWITFGSADASGPYRLLVTADNRGAAISRIELSDRKYRELGSVGNLARYGLKTSGYLGHLQLTDSPDGRGAVVNVVGAGTPAAIAKPVQAGVEPGLRKGDVIVAVDDVPFAFAEEVETAIRRLPGGGPPLVIQVRRGTGAEARTIEFQAMLNQSPTQLVSPETQLVQGAPIQHPLSFEFGLQNIGDWTAGKRAKPADDALPLEVARHESEPGLEDVIWEITQRPTKDVPTVEFRTWITSSQMDGIGQSGALEIKRRYTLARVPADEPEGSDSPAYRLRMEIEIVNHHDDIRQISYRLSGPTGLPLEGWWYTYKIHPRMFASAGIRDVFWRSKEGKHQLFGCKDITNRVKKDPQSPLTPLFTDTNHETVRYVGVDTQYFAAAILPVADGGPVPTVQAAMAGPVGLMDEQRITRTNVSFRLTSSPVSIAPQGTIQHSYDIFAGPKRPDLLAAYGLSEVIIYGWFGMVSEPMIRILHFFYGIIPNYGIAIVCLTLLVRGGLFPLGRKQAKMAAKMQELTPEMKKIKEKYKNDMEKQSKAQQELFKKHNYNPLSGCLPMILQLPIFLGLYRALGSDIELRGAPLIPGISWCSNLSAPDMLFYWGDWPLQFLMGDTGFLGPFLNIFPLFTIFFFMIHQKLFTPPPTDEQGEMQQKMMKFMLIFMGFLFFRVAAGLCMYIIVSSVWGLGERLLLPKIKPKDAVTPTPSPEKPTPQESTNGAGGKGKRKKKSKGRK